MFYDLNVPWTSNQPEFTQRVKFLGELGYNVLAASHLLPTKLPSDLTSPIVLPPTTSLTSRTKLLTRCTLPLSSTSQNPGARIADLRQSYDILALRPTDEKTLLQATTTLDCDLISLNLAIRYPFHFRPKTFTPALARGVKLELCYSSGILGGDAEQRRNVLANATEIVRATRGRGIVISGEASSVLGARAPHDVVNLAVLWGLKQEMGMEAVGNAARSVVAAAVLRKSSFRGAVQVVQVCNGPPKAVEGDGQDGESSVAFDPPKSIKKGETGAQKANSEAESSVAFDPPKLSKRAQKKANKRKAEEDAAGTGDAALKKIKT